MTSCPAPRHANAPRTSRSAFCTSRSRRSISLPSLGIEIDLRLRDVQKAERLVLGAFACLGAGQLVIRRRKNFRGPPGRGSKGSKRTNERQRLLRMNVISGKAVLIAGPTASGKSALALSLAEK